ncbi:glutathione S-transferase family protein [Labrys neptuniae]
MEPILFSGYPAGSSLGLVAAFEWLGQPYRVTRVQMPEDMLTEAFTHVNGRQETPVLIREDGSVLTETTAIARWLELRDEERRISFAPGSAEAHRMHQLIGFINSSFTGAFTPLWVVLEMQDGSEEYREALRCLGRELVARRHRQLEAMIGSSPYLGGDRPSLADGVFIGVARWADFHQAIDFTPYPKIQALKARLEADPAVRFGHAIEDGVPATGSGAMRALLPLDEVLSQVKVPLAA